MRIDILTVLPGLLKGPFAESIVKRGIEKGLVEVHLHDIRKYTKDKHKRVDDTPFGGAAGMVLEFNPSMMQLRIYNHKGTTMRWFF